MKLLEECQYYSDLENTAKGKEWEEVWKIVRFSQRVLQFVNQLQKLGVDKKIINEVNNNSDNC